MRQHTGRSLQFAPSQHIYGNVPHEPVSIKSDELELFAMMKDVVGYQVEFVLARRLKVVNIAKKAPRLHLRLPVRERNLQTQIVIQQSGF